MNRVKKSKIIITIAVLYIAGVTPLLCAANGKNANGHVQDLRDSQAYQQGRYDEEHNKPYRENELYRLSRKKEAYRLGRQEYAKDLAEGKIARSAFRSRVNKLYYEKRTSVPDLYDHGPMYGNNNIPGR